MRNIDKLKIKLANVTIQLTKCNIMRDDMLNSITEMRHKQTELIMLIEELERNDTTYFAEAIE